MDLREFISNLTKYRGRIKIDPGKTMANAPMAWGSDGAPVNPYDAVGNLRVTGKQERYDWEHGQTTTANGTAAVWDPDTGTIYEVVAIKGTMKCDANVADRVPFIKILTGYNGVLTALPSAGEWVCPTGPTLSASQQGGILLIGQGFSFIYLNDNGSVSQAGAVQGELPFPLYIEGAGNISLDSTNKQATDALGIDVIARRLV